MTTSISEALAELAGEFAGVQAFQVDLPVGRQDAQRNGPAGMCKEGVPAALCE